MWQKIVHDLYRGEDTPAKRRQRHLILDVPVDAWVPRNRLVTVSARIAGEYAGSGSKTLTRDINELVKRGLLVRGGKGYRANSDVVDAFLPAALGGGAPSP